MSQTPLHRKPWFWAVVISGVTMLLVPLLLVGWLIGQLGPKDTGKAICITRFDVTCTDVKPEAIAELTAMELPPGTVVEESRYDAFQDWRLKAVVVLPAEHVDDWEASLDTYEPATAEQCTAPADDVVCAERRHEVDGIWGGYERRARPDGTVEVAVEAFSI